MGTSTIKKSKKNLRRVDSVVSLDFIKCNLSKFEQLRQ